DTAEELHGDWVGGQRHDTGRVLELGLPKQQPRCLDHSGSMIERSNSITVSSRWLRPRVWTVTMPKPGRDRDSRFSSTSVSARIVSPAKTGACSRTSRQPRFTPCSDTSSTDNRVKDAGVNEESTRSRPLLAVI